MTPPERAPRTPCSPGCGYRARVDQGTQEDEDGAHDAPDQGRAGGRPGAGAALWLVLAAVALEALLLVGIAGLFLFALGTDREVDTGASVATAVFALSFAVLLGAAGRGLLRGRRWARAPVLTVQLLVLLALAVPMLLGGPRWAGAALAVLALAAGAGLFVPSVMEHTSATDSPPTL